MRCLARDPSSRFPDAEEVGAALDKLAKATPTVRGARGRTAAERRSPSGERGRAVGGRQPGPGRSPWPYVVAGVAALALIAGIAFKRPAAAILPAVTQPPIAAETVSLPVPAASPEEAAPVTSGAFDAAGLALQGKNAQGFDVYKCEKDGSLLIHVPAGAFRMGDDSAEADERPACRVTLDGYLIGRTEVTNEQFERFSKAKGYRTTAQRRAEDATWRHPQAGDSPWWGPAHPVVFISWEDADAYCSWAGLRLPTEAEWERACRGVQEAEYPWGAQGPSGSSGLLGNFAGQETVKLRNDWQTIPEYDDGFPYTAPAGSFAPGASSFGALDMAGNVYEWCFDWYDPEYYAARTGPVLNPRGPTDGSARVLRGGCWKSTTPALRASGRFWGRPLAPDATTGFRPARSLPR